MGFKHGLVVSLFILQHLQWGFGQSFVEFNTTCERNYVVDISNGVRSNSNKSIKFRNITYLEDKYFIKDGVTYGCVCDVDLCISKCCTENHPENLKCAENFRQRVNVDVYHDNITVAVKNVNHTSTHWKKCKYFELEEEEYYYIKKDGKLFFQEDDKHYDLHEYCIAQNENKDQVHVRICITDEEIENQVKPEIIHKIGMLISIPFLFATLVVYLILPDKKIQTKCQMAYITCLMLAYVFIVYLMFDTQINSPQCEIIGACGVYFFLSTFCWMNITCVDMYLTFSGKRAPMQGNSSKWKRFTLYCLFANGAPFILLAIIFGVNTLPSFKGHPQFGKGMCWIADGLAQLYFFYGPMAILIIINLVLFIITAHTIRSTIRDNQKMLRTKESQRHHDSNKQDYVLYIKLFGAMGINWIMELISWIVDWSLGNKEVSWVWYPTDFFNAIYGIFIFVLFVCKRAVWVKLKHRYYLFMGKPNMARALFTRTSGHQMSDTDRTNVDDTTVTTTNTYNQIKLEQM